MIDALALLSEYSDKQFDSRHRLCIVASQRAKQLNQGAKPKGPSRFTKETTVALDETLRGQVKFVIGEEARLAAKEAKRGKEGELERMMMDVQEDAREIKKELSVLVDETSVPKEPESDE